MNIKEINEQNKINSDRIKKDVVLKFLRSHLEPISDVEVAMELDLPVSLVKQELNRLVDSNAIVVSSAPMQGDLTSGGLIYQFVK